MLRLSQPTISDEAISAVTKVLKTGYLVHGVENEAFEKELSSYLGCHDVVVVSSGTAALHLALWALNIGPGDSVIVPDFTFPATANVIRLVGAKPIIVDVDPDSYTIAIDKLEDTLQQLANTENIKAIMPVHEFGYPVNMQELQRLAENYNLYIIEDAACALGASDRGLKVGTLGDIGCFSFHPRKTLTTGEGGALAINNGDLANRLRRLRNHGIEHTALGVKFTEPSTNYRLTNFQAALGRHQLPNLDVIIEKRRQLSLFYLEVLSDLVDRGFIRCPNICLGHSLQTFMIVLSQKFDRKVVIDRLREVNIESNLGAQSLSTIGIYGEQPNIPITGPNLFYQGLAIPFHENLKEEELIYVASMLSSILLSLS